MILIFALVGLLLVGFGGVLLVGAPYLPTLTSHVEVALDLADLQPGDTMLELGCGDGKVLIAAARRGLNVVGYELNPWMYIICRLRTLRYRRQVTVIWGDFWQRPWPEAQGIFIFLLQRHMRKLDKKVMQYKHKPVKVVSFAFQMPGHKPVREASNVFLYEYR